MGGTSLSFTASGYAAGAVYDDLVAEAIQMYGDNPYAGTIACTDRLVTKVLQGVNSDALVPADKKARHEFWRKYARKHEDLLLQGICDNGDGNIVYAIPLGVTEYHVWRYKYKVLSRASVGLLQFVVGVSTNGCAERRFGLSDTVEHARQHAETYMKSGLIGPNSTVTIYAYKGNGHCVGLGCYEITIKATRRRPIAKSGVFSFPCYLYWFVGWARE